MTDNETAERPPQPQALADAIERFDRGDLEGCHTLLEQARRETEPDVPADVDLFEGMCARREGDLERAVRHLRAAVERAPEADYVLLELGLALIEGKQTQEGLDVLRQAVHASGEAPRMRHEFYLQNAIALYGEGYLDAAVTSLKKALRFGKDADTYRLLGHFLLESDKHDEALDAIREGLEHFASDAEMHHIAGLALAMKRQHFEAAQAFTRAIELAPHNGEPMHSLGMCFESLNDCSRAIEAYERCLRLQCGDWVRSDARERIERLKGLLQQ